MAQAGFLLGQVLSDHPGMKPIVVRETEAFIFRPGLQERARYYAVVFLNQLVLSRNPAHGELGWTACDLALPTCGCVQKAADQVRVHAVNTRYCEHILISATWFFPDCANWHTRSLDPDKNCPRSEHEHKWPTAGAGGSALAEQLVNVYLSVFQLIMRGQIGHAAELRHTADAKAEAAKKSAKAGGWRRRPSAREQRRRTKDKAAKQSNGAAVTPINQVRTRS